MKPLSIIRLLLPLAVPILGGLLLRNALVVPDRQSIVQDLQSTDKRSRSNALDWIEASNRPSFLPHVEPLLFSEDLNAADRAAKVLRSICNPASVAPLIRAWEETDINRIRLLHTIGNIRTPESLAFLDSQLNHEDRRIAIEAQDQYRDSTYVINFEMTHHSVGQRVYTRLDNLIESQALLFPRRGEDDAQ